MLGEGPLIGRATELAELERTLISKRLVTVTGAGGCGKTRLALELAGRVAAGPEQPRALVVELAGVVGAERIVSALSQAVGARERFGSSPTQVLFDRLGRANLLLVLDNCEHVVGAVGSLTAELLAAAPGMRVLATSREPLGLEDEHVFPLGPLGVPDRGDVSGVVRSDAGRLFVDRAVMSDPAFSLTPSVAGAVARICQELDGLPLALTLAAARLDSLSASEVADGLARHGRLSSGTSEDELPHHRSVRASLDWSYQLLEAREQATLRRLSAFSGGFTTAAAHAVASPGTGETGVRDLLTALEAKGLVVTMPAKNTERWTLLQTVGDYAAAQLATEGERSEVADRHLAWFRRYAVQADAVLIEKTAHELIDAESANLKRALDRAIDVDRAAAFDIVASLMRHWILAEHFEEARSASAAVLALTGDHMDPAACAIVHCGAGLIGLLGEDYAGAIVHTRSGLELLAGVEDPGVQSLCLIFSSIVLIQTGLDLEEGLRAADRALELARSAGDQLGLGYALVNAETAATTCDQFDAVRTAYAEFLAIPSASGHSRLRTWAELAAAWAEVLEGSPQRALAHTDQALALEGDAPSMTHFQLLGFRVQALARLGRTHEALDEGARALARAQESQALQAIPALELALMVAELMHADADAAAARANRLLGVPQLHTLALAREALARIALTRRDANEANLQCGELESLAERSGSSRQRVLVEFVGGCAAVLEGNIDRGRDRLHAALEMCVEFGLEREAADLLDELALLAGDAGEVARAARLAAAASAARVRLTCAPLPDTIERLHAARMRLADEDDALAWEAAWAEGSELSLSDAIAYARRRRGRRDRPPAGWGSLTPAEFEVARLAASGISNPQIGSQLFIARSTVKMHLSNVFMKLHVANRTELAAAMAVHSSLMDSTDREDRAAGNGGMIAQQPLR